MDSYRDSSIYGIIDVLVHVQPELEDAPPKPVQVEGSNEAAEFWRLRSIPTSRTGSRKTSPSASVHRLGRDSQRLRFGWDKCVASHMCIEKILITARVPDESSATVLSKVNAHLCAHHVSPPVTIYMMLSNKNMTVNRISMQIRG